VYLGFSQEQAACEECPACSFLLFQPQIGVIKMQKYLTYLPNGEYLADIKNIDRRMDKKNRQVVCWDLRIVDGQYAGQYVPKRFYLDYKKSVDFLKKELSILGVEVANAQDLDKNRLLVIGKRIRMTSVSEGESMSLYVKEVVETPERDFVAMDSDW
jgi:hypothetical protein